MDSKNLFREHGRGTGMPRRMRFPRLLRVAAGDVGLTLFCGFALVGLYVLGAAADEPVDPAVEALALAERAQLQAVKMCLLAQAEARP